MKTKFAASKIFAYFRKRKKENLLTGALMFIAGLIALSFGINHFLDTIPNDSLAMTAINTLIADALASLLLMAPSLVLFSAAYMLWEGHSLGWKIATGTCIAALFSTGLGYTNVEIGIALATSSGLAAFLSIRLKRSTQKLKDSPTSTENIAKLGLTISGLISIGILVGMIIYTGIRASPYLSLDFFTNTRWGWLNAAYILHGEATGSMGGILGFAIGSLYLVSVCELIALPLGLGAAIYLAEYSSQNILTSIVRFFIETLAGIPSVVIGLVGLSVFVLGAAHWGNSLLGGGLSLAFMILPWNIRIAEEALRAVPATYREASFALGATQWQTIRRAVLFAASPGIITGVLLGVGAALGETIVVAMTAGEVDVGPQILPSDPFAFGSSIPSLPVFVWRAPLLLIIGSHGGNAAFDMYSVALAGAFVLIMIYLVICAMALVARNYLTKKITGK